MSGRGSWLSGVIGSFLQGQLSVLLIVISLAAGGVALLVTPREEEPQIVVPMADVMVSYPGGSAEEVERRVASRLERLLYQIDGVEYVYSMSRPGMAVVTVRFYVGQDRTDSLIKLYNKIFQNIDRTTPGIAGWVVKPVEIDDVPIVGATFHSDRLDTHALRRVAEEAVDKLQHVKDSARITIHGGSPRAVRVQLDPDRLAAHDLSPSEIAGALKLGNSQAGAGSFSRGDREIAVEVGPFLRDVDEVRSLMVGVHDGRPVYLRDVADVVDGPQERTSYSRIGFGPADPAFAGAEGARTQAAVTVAIAKKKGSNAVRVAHEVEKTIEELRTTTIPAGVEVRITRNYGETADEKVNDLVKSLSEAVITVIALIALAMNWRVGLIVALAVPITYALTLLVNLLAGYTINRVTLFALILALGLLVDDPIVAVENIFRHLQMKKLPRNEAVLAAMTEVMPPIILATLAVIVAFLPMFFITGMMGPYMRPMALNMPLAMLGSLLVSFTITPWVSAKMLKTGAGAGLHHEPENVEGTATYRIYARMMRPFIESRGKTRLLLLVMAALFGAAVWLALAVVPLKMLPFDNKNELQLVVDLPESATLERTDAVVTRLEGFLRTLPEVREFTSYVGTASPMDFNGMVRHYYLREGANVGDIRIGLIHRRDRVHGSHEIALRIRPEVERIARETGANVKIVEMPPGPPVLSTIVAEIYGEPQHAYADLIAAAKTVRAQMEKEPGVVDVDDMVEDPQTRLFFEVDREKAGLNGIASEDVAQTLQIALGGLTGGTVHLASEQNELPIVLRLPRDARSDAERLKTVAIKGRTGRLVQIGEIGRFREDTVDRTIFHKNQERVVYVTADTAGRGPAYAVLALQKHFAKSPLPAGLRIDWRGEGEWKITLDVFRDLGLAFAAALLAIYVLLVYQTKSYVMPLVIMLSIPMTMLGIMPGFSLLNVIASRPVGGYDNPVFFTATAMIGMIALAGIVVRNGIILVDFIATAVERGLPLKDAILQSGAVRFRPIFLTASAAMLGAWPITLDPIFSGLAWSLIFGLFVSTAFTMLVIPATYNLLFARRAAAGRAGGPAGSPTDAAPIEAAAPAQEG